MNTKAQIKKFEQTISAISSIARVFQNAATEKMKVNRQEIDRIGVYLQEAQRTYSLAKRASLEPKLKLREMLLTAPVRKTGGRVLVLVSSENRYFGSLILGLFNKFMQEYRRGGADAVILGKVGKEYFVRANLGKTLPPGVSFFDLDDDNADFSNISQIAKQISKYSQIVIFYGEYESVFRQEAKTLEIADISEDAKVGEKKYKFAPRPYEALSFLEEQVISGKFVQKLYESGLAKFGYRVKILQIGEVAEKISEAYLELARSRKKVTKGLKNRKQNELFSAAPLWGREEIVSVS